ncbi:MAG: GlxA family transcriptional regulator [Paracoccaceae bacterium]|nr:GlxA family transcriptional regulator [Paracoccaceae bacterium]
MQKDESRAENARRVGVLLFERFSNHCLANSVEPLRVCNTILGRKVYDWVFLSMDGRPVTSSSGLPVAANLPLAQSGNGDVLLLLPSYGFRELTSAANCRALRAAAGRYQVIAGMDSGSWLLAAAGLLSDRRATIHWEELEGFAEAFPDVEVERARVVRDGNRWSCAGASTAFDLVLDMIRDHHGALVALEVAAFLMHGSVGADAPITEGGPELADPIVIAAVSVMRESLEEPLSLAALAKRIGVTPFQLKDRFARDLRRSPGAVYREMRLSAARRYVEQTRLSIAEIAVRCGYVDPAAMTRAFRQEFGEPPRALRRAGREASGLFFD